MLRLVLFFFFFCFEVKGGLTGYRRVVIRPPTRRSRRVPVLRDGG